MESCTSATGAGVAHTKGQEAGALKFVARQRRRSSSVQQQAQQRRHKTCRPPRLQAHVLLLPFSSAACCSWKRRSRVSVQRSCTGPAGSTCSQQCHPTNSRQLCSMTSACTRPVLWRGPRLARAAASHARCLQACMATHLHTMHKH